VVALLIDPAGQCTANPIMSPCRGVGMTGSPPGLPPAGTPGHEQSTAHHHFDF
jgi:hypothetical protein